MNNSINCSGFVGMLVDKHDTYDYYKNTISDAEPEIAKSSIQCSTAIINDGDYGSSNE
jgi:endo-alpha-1,4-polygalactosaminidase (GH114 family)